MPHDGPEGTEGKKEAGTAAPSMKVAIKVRELFLTIVEGAACLG